MNIPKDAYPRQAIVTKYHGPTNHRGSRVSATAEAGRVTITWDAARSSQENHQAAALALMSEMGWRGTWYPGALPDGRTVFVQAT